ncbi:ATP-binding cassette domain-containing protein, partial [Vibrio cholerae]
MNKINKDEDLVISVEGLSKYYKLYNSPKSRLLEALHPFKKKYHETFYALDGITFKIKNGETIGIIGKNGAGKSTLLKILTGVVQPSEGAIRVKGKIASLLELGAGFNPEMTGLENIYLNGTLMGFSRSEIDGKIKNIIDFADIGDFVYQPVKMYSSGMFARLAFSVAINVNPDILIIDEALSVGDIRFQLKCMEKFDEFRKLGKTILFVTHDINAVKRFCSSCIWINNGKLEAIGNTDFVTDRYLDFLKSQDEENSVEDLVVNNQIAEIVSLDIVVNGGFTTEINYGNDVTISICYMVHDDTIKQPVLGVAIHSIDNKYICG